MWFQGAYPEITSLLLLVLTDYLELGLRTHPASLSLSEKKSGGKCWWDFWCAIIRFLVYYRCDGSGAIEPQCEWKLVPDLTGGGVIDDKPLWSLALSSLN